MPKKHELAVPSHIRNGLFFVNVTHVKLMQRSDGQTTIVSLADLQKKLKPKDYERISNDIALMGEYKDGSFHAIAYSPQS